MKHTPDSSKTTQRMKRAYSPYVRESILCLVIDVIVLAGAYILGMVATDGAFTLGLLFSIGLWGYLCFAAVLASPVINFVQNYRHIIMSFFEKRVPLLAETDVMITDIDTENTINHPRYEYSSSVVGKLYPASAGVCRLRLFCVTTDGKRIKLRCCMKSRRKEEQYLMQNKNKLYHIVYGRFTKIIISAYTSNSKGQRKQIFFCV